MSTAAASAAQTAVREFKNHELDEDFARPGVRYEKRPAHTPDGKVVPGRSYTVGSLTTGTPYSYRITCGPSGAARVAGVFTTN